jgi:hypothetical protein
MLTAMQRLDLMDKLDELIISTDTVTGLDKLDVLDNIDSVMAQLGFDGITPPPAPEPEPVPTPEPIPTPTPDIQPEDVPQVIQDFRDGKYKGMVAMRFVAMLKEVKEYVGGLVSFGDVTGWADDWYRSSSYFEG